MSEARGYIPKTALTAEEKLKVAYFYLCKGVAMHTLADMFDVNSGRIAGAVNIARAAFKFDGYADLQQATNHEQD
jgi:hypothetical protein